MQAIKLIFGLATSVFNFPSPYNTLSLKLWLKINDLNPKLSKLYCLPGNAGTNLIAENVNLDIYDFEKLGKFVDENQIDLVIELKL